MNLRIQTSTSNTQKGGRSLGNTKETTTKKKKEILVK